MTREQCLAMLHEEALSTDLGGQHNFHVLLFLAAQAALGYRQRITFLSRRQMACYVTNPETGLSEKHLL